MVIKINIKSTILFSFLFCLIGCKHVDSNSLKYDYPIDSLYQQRIFRWLYLSNENIDTVLIHEQVFDKNSKTYMIGWSKNDGVLLDSAIYEVSGSDLLPIEYFKNIHDEIENIFILQKADKVYTRMGLFNRKKTINYSRFQPLYEGKGMIKVNKDVTYFIDNMDVLYKGHYLDSQHFKVKSSYILKPRKLSLIRINIKSTWDVYQAENIGLIHGFIISDSIMTEIRLDSIYLAE